MKDLLSKRQTYINYKEKLLRDRVIQVLGGALPIQLSDKDDRRSKEEKEHALYPQFDTYTHLNT